MLKIADGSSSRIGSIVAWYLAGSTVCTHGLSMLAQSSCASQHGGLQRADRRRRGEVGRLHRAHRSSRTRTSRRSCSSMKPVVAGLSNSGGRKRAQRAVADVEALARVEQVDPVERDGPLGRQDPDAEERRDDARVRRGLEQRPQPAGVVAVGVGDPDPADVGGVDRRREVATRSPCRRCSARCRRRPAARRGGRRC